MPDEKVSVASKADLYSAHKSRLWDCDFMQKEPKARPGLGSLKNVQSWQGWRSFDFPGSQPERWEIALNVAAAWKGMARK